MRITLNIQPEGEKRILSYLKRQQEVEIEEVFSDTSENAGGKPLTVAEYNQALDEAEADFESGRFLSAHELRRKADNW